MTQHPASSSANGSIEYLNPDHLHKNRAFTHVISVSGPVKTIYIGGQNAIDRARKHCWQREHTSPDPAGSYQYTRGTCRSRSRASASHQIDHLSGTRTIITRRICRVSKLLGRSPQPANRQPAIRRRTGEPGLSTGDRSRSGRSTRITAAYYIPFHNGSI